jgi:hypothetical protein
MAVKRREMPKLKSQRTRRLQPCHRSAKAKKSPFFGLTKGNKKLTL